MMGLTKCIFTQENGGQDAITCEAPKEAGIPDVGCQDRTTEDDETIDGDPKLKNGPDGCAGHHGQDNIALRDGARRTVERQDAKV